MDNMKQPAAILVHNTGYTSIADTGRLGMKLRNVLLYWVFFQHRSSKSCI